MSLSIDHIVIFVNDVNEAIETYRRVGFTTFYGGKHASGITHNGLVIFDDGSYLELIALVEPGPIEQSEFHHLLRKDGSEGYSGYALLSDDLESEAERIRAAGIESEDVRPGSRTRTDGEILEWKMVRLEQNTNPFVIEDVTPRLLRVPAEGDNIEHKNGALGIAEVRILVADLDAAIKRYEAIAGTSAVQHEGKAVIALAQGTIVLSHPADDAQRVYLEAYGSIPYELVLIGRGDPISAKQAHGARFVFAG